MRLGLIAALATAVLAPAAMISAQPKAQPEITDAQRKAGMAEAPALVQAAGLPCQISDARLIGKNEDKKAKTSTSYYEVACGASMGYLIMSPSGGSPTAFTCIEANTPQGEGKEAAAPCKLPGNADPKAQLAAAMAKAGTQCTPTAARGLGQTKANTYLEIACQGGTGYIVVASTPFDPAKELKAQNCLNFDDTQGNIKCSLTDRATRLAIVDRLAQDAKTGCAVADRRYMGQSKDGDNFYEASCQDGKGYIFRVNNAGAVAQNWECAKGQNILGGCTLTDTRAATNAQAGLYTRLAKSAGSNCDVDRYATFPMTVEGQETVELVCKDGSGAIGTFKANGTGTVMDCGRALAAGYKCTLSKPSYAGLTADLRKFNQQTCTVSNAQPAAKTQKGTVFVEVACADGYKGYMIEYNVTPSVTAVGATGCSFIGGCKLPGNT
jgi:hypothetical protein